MGKKERVSKKLEEGATGSSITIMVVLSITLFFIALTISFIIPLEFKKKLYSRNTLGLFLLARCS